VAVALDPDAGQVLQCLRGKDLTRRLGVDDLDLPRGLAQRQRGRANGLEEEGVRARRQAVFEPLQEQSPLPISEGGPRGPLARTAGMLGGTRRFSTHRKAPGWGEGFHSPRSGSVTSGFKSRSRRSRRRSGVRGTYTPDTTWSGVASRARVDGATE